MVSGKKDGIKIEGHFGTWYIIGENHYDGGAAFLLEHEIYGDEVACLIVDKDGKVILGDVWNGFSDLYDLIDNEASNYIDIPIYSEEIDENGNHDIIGYRKEYIS